MDENTPCSTVTTSLHEGDLIPVPVILGPTAVGKSAVALSIAEEMGWEILSCDSRQLYRGMDIGTAKPTREERNRVRHWLIDILEPSEEYSAGRFADEAAAIIRDRAKQGKRVLICGGTGLYFRALQQGRNDRAPSDPAVREELTRYVERHGSDALHRDLSDVDPVTAARLHPNDAQRIIRALALFRQTGQTLTDLTRQEHPPVDMRFVVVKMTMERTSLYERINRRVDTMMRAGLREEFRRLLQAGYDRHAPGLQSVGYREFFEVEDGGCSEEDAVELIRRNSRRYAKRQITWFSRQVDGVEVNALDGENALQQMRECLRRGE